MKTVTEQEIREKLNVKFGKTLKQIQTDPNANIPRIVDWLLWQYRNLPSREFGRAKALIQRLILQ